MEPVNHSLFITSSHHKTVNNPRLYCGVLIYQIGHSKIFTQISSRAHSRFEYNVIWNSTLRYVHLVELIWTVRAKGRVYAHQFSPKKLPHKLAGFKILTPCHVGMHPNSAPLLILSQIQELQGIHQPKIAVQMLQYMKSNECHVRNSVTKPHKSYGDMVCSLLLDWSLWLPYVTIGRNPLRLSALWGSETATSKWAVSSKWGIEMWAEGSL